jgi:hypothetical protein
MDIRGLGSYHHRPDNAAVRFGQQAAASTASVSAAARTSRTSGSLTVKTDDGDLVTLSYSAMAMLAASQIGSRDGNSKVAAGSTTNAQSVSVSLSVAGDLDKEEWADLAKLFKSFFSALKDLVRQRPEKALEHMARTPNLESVSEFSYALQRQDSVVLSAAQAS